jgi:RNA recognition motif-containing protein
MRLYVGNLAPSSTEQQLQTLVSQFGKAESVKIVTERTTGESRGFGFVEFPNDAEGKAAIAGLDGKDFNGQALKVNEARPQNTGGGGGGRR